jgi:hypothetical protein
LRWHRELVARHWTFPRKREVPPPHTGRPRPGLPDATIELLLRLAPII